MRTLEQKLFLVVYNKRDFMCRILALNKLDTVANKRGVFFGGRKGKEIMKKIIKRTEGWESVGSQEECTAID
jgi:hypothetical protein